MTRLLRATTAALLLLILGHAAAAQTAPPDRVRLYGEQKWISGGNVAWVNFARDVGPGDTNFDRIREAFRQVHDNGGNSMRLWLHTNGASTPAWSTSTQGAVTGPGVGTIADIRAILDIAEDEEIGVQLCLWSFDMLRTSYGDGITGRNRSLLGSAALTQTYIDNALTPMVDALKDHRAILSWEVFNEPEGMSQEFGFGGIVSAALRVPMTDIQRFTNQIAGAVHRADPAALVTNGSVNMRTLSDILPAANEFNYYRDDRLIAIGGDPLGTLDFYNVHYYTNNVPASLSPFNHDASYWGVDKPIVVAEFFAPDVSPPSTAFGDLYTTLYDRGYAGAMIWQFIESPVGQSLSWTRGLENMATMFALHRADVDVVVPGPDVLDFGAMPEQILIGAASTLAWTVEEATGVTINGTPVAISGTLTVSPTTPTNYVLVASDAAGLTESRTVRVDVRTEATLNRAVGRPTTASSGEGGTGNADPALAVDGNLGTRWSSAWNLAANPDPDDEFIAIDLGAAYDVSRVLLTWEVAYGATYDIDVSLDGQTWATVREVRDGDGGEDDLAIAGTPRARFVRMHGYTRGTNFGFSLYEFEVNGLRSTQQPPAVALTAPVPGTTLDVGATVQLAATATDADGTAPTVEFYAGETLLATVAAAPYVAPWTPGLGTYEVSAVAVDTDGTRVRTATVSVSVIDPDAIVRYEAEAAVLVGATFAEPLAGASGGQAVTMYDVVGVGMTWTVQAPADGTYPVAFAYAPTYGPKTQNVVVNGAAPEAVPFPGGTPALRVVTRPLALRAGPNEVRLEAGDGFMTVDYLEILVGTPDEDGADAAALAIERVFPNPATTVATVRFRTGVAGPVRLAVYDALGRLVAVLSEGDRAAGSHSAEVRTDALAAGVYLVRLEAGGEVRTQRLAVVR